jgi:large subunit ribosomal protein L11
MAKKPVAQVKLQCIAGKANPAPPIGPALGQHGVNIAEFCKQYNAATQKDAGAVVPCVITIYSDRSFSFILKTPPTSFLIKKAAGLDKGSQKPGKDKAGKITRQQVVDIAKVKQPDLDIALDSVVKSVEGSARSMGIEVVG